MTNRTDKLKIRRNQTAKQALATAGQQPESPVEQARSRSRQRESLQQEKQRLAAQGRSHALSYRLAKR